MKIVAIVNPMSGAGMDTTVAGRRVAMIRDEIRRRGLDGSIRVTERRGHARELASNAAEAGADLVIAWGGDGTVNEVGAGLEGSATTLGLMPAGSGNGLAGALGIPRKPEAALASATNVRAAVAGGCPISPSACAKGAATPASTTRSRWMASRQASWSTRC
jgi:diacylglycerol kinase family enzyme